MLLRGIAVLSATFVAVSVGVWQQDQLERSLNDTPVHVFGPPTPHAGYLTVRELTGAAHLVVGFEESAERQAPLSDRRAESHSGQSVLGGTVRDALDRFVQMNPRYEWREMNGVPVIRPRAAWTDPRDPLNQRVETFSCLNADWHSVLLDIAHLMNPSIVRPASGPPAGGWNLTLNIDGATILEILNHAVRSDGHLSWWLRCRESNGSVEFGLGLCPFDGKSFEVFPVPPPSR